jgi:uncharacterized alpha-E superfamily protein
LLDVKYHLLLRDPAEVGSTVDVSQWNALLRSASAYHAYRRVQPSGMSPASVAGFLLFHEDFPRSVHACIKALGATLADIRTRYGLAAGVQAMAEVEALRGSLDGTTIEAVIAGGLHEFIDGIQIKLIAITGSLGREFFGYPATGREAS